VYLTLVERLRAGLASHIREKYGVELAVVLERPPKIEMGEAASPVCFELAKRLKKAPRMIAQEIANSFGKVPGISKVEVAGGGYLNAYFDRGGFWSEVGSSQGLKPLPSREADVAPEGASHKAQSQKELTIEGAENADSGSGVGRGAETARVGGGKIPAGKIIVEHTSINPNKAAHIGHVRNAVLGDTMARTLRVAGHNVQVQNYIDNTGVQVADVVIGFLEMEKRTPVSVKMMAMEPRFDYLCWDLYATATNFFAEDKARAAALRGATLRAIEEGRGEEAEVAETVADSIVSFHLRTMARLGIAYDLLARESEILHLHFWDAAFEKLKEAKAIYKAEVGKMAGCWVMPWNDSSNSDGSAAEPSDPDDENSQDKIIVRSNGTVTYVGKDIAYQLWKFGLLGKDFNYARWKNAPEGETVWATTARKGEADAPHFGDPAVAVFNVIDSRQAYLQQVVAAGLKALGHAKEAERSIHLSYEIVALTPRCAAELGYELSPEETKKAYVEVSGRKGFGVKADDLIDKLEGAALAEVMERHPEMDDAERMRTAHAIAIGALRFFLMKFTRGTIIAFDFKDALSFEGETGPYCQYAVVRIRGIRRKGAEAAAAEGDRVAVTRESAAKFLAGTDGSVMWELLLAVGSLDSAIDAAITAQEPAFLAKYAFQLAQGFNNFYHKHHILSEGDAEKRAFLLAMTEVVERELVRVLELLGIEAPEKM
jgi:arginyl-tRNA synthetase